MTPELLIDWIEVRAVVYHRSAEMKSEVSCSNSSIVDASLMRWCAVLLKHERVTSDTFDSRKHLA